MFISDEYLVPTAVCVHCMFSQSKSIVISSSIVRPLCGKCMPVCCGLV